MSLIVSVPRSVPKLSAAVERGRVEHGRVEHGWVEHGHVERGHVECGRFEPVSPGGAKLIVRSASSTDRLRQRDFYVSDSVSTDRPTAARSAAKKILGRNDPTDRPSSAGSRPRSRVGMLFFMLFEGYLGKMWYIACIPDSGRPDRPTRPNPTRPSRTDPTDRPSLRSAADAERTINFAPATAQLYFSCMTKDPPHAVQA